MKCEEACDEPGVTFVSQNVLLFISVIVATLPIYARYVVKTAFDFVQH